MRRHFRRPSPALVIACLALLVALSGTSVASVAQFARNSVGTPQLKRNAVTAQKVAPNAIRGAHVLDGSLLTADFKPGQIPQGPKGDKGEKGEKGDKGQKGDQGLPGLAGRQVVSGSSASDSTALKSAIATCPAGTVPIGGGSGLQGAASGIGVLTSSPLGTGWKVNAHEIVSNTGDWRVSAVAICAKVSP